ncbi:hypothetical protein EDD18DRAFT_1344396 [Armillaria luteobubalina]|uniref:Uncharacterized protein n=1 Tax=Armillaria luteobubalina TaxID=153913 RepID=A0AA39QMC5_9AGAR|nr:hypothetical protein EDD18DRAFT_1344396 [Armillaria luteobubalina]
MTESPYNRVFFLASDEEEAMLLYVAEYWNSRRLGGQTLENMRSQLWEASLAKFPIDFIALTGRSSTKEDEEDCRHRKLRCIEAYLHRMGSLTDGHGLEMLQSAINFLEEQEAIHVNAPLPQHSSPGPKNQLHPGGRLYFLPTIACHSKEVETGGIQIFANLYYLFSPKFALRTYARGKRSKTLDVTEDLPTPSVMNLKRPLHGSQAMLAYPVVKRKKIDTMRPSMAHRM